ncbi:hypothetical protein V8G54_008614 [Vigna mungo]|uniref:Uncharacterized protein n=1 Tax=Vigna mungo TaxID=3915 RepID=A0AAQ3P620_VIGMU
MHHWTFTPNHCRSCKPSPLNNFHHCYQQHNLKLKYKHLFDVKIMDRQEHGFYFCCEKEFYCNDNCRAHSFLLVIKEEEDIPLQGVAKLTPLLEAQLGSHALAESKTLDQTLRVLGHVARWIVGVPIILPNKRMHSHYALRDFHNSVEGIGQYAHVGPPPYSDELPLQLVDNSSLVYPLATLGLKKKSVSTSSVKIALVHWQGLSPDDTSWKNLDDLPLPTLRARLLQMGWPRPVGPNGLKNRKESQNMFITERRGIIRSRICCAEQNAEPLPLSFPEEPEFLQERQEVCPGAIELLNLARVVDQIGVEEANGVLEMANLRATVEDLSIEVLQLPLRLEERGRAERDLLHEMELHNIEVVRELLLQREVLGNVGEGAGGAERSSVLEAEVLFEVERGDLAEAGDERLTLAGGGGSIGEVVDLFLGGVVTDVLEAMVGFGDRDDVVVEVRSGNLGGGLGNSDGSELGRGDCGGGGPPGAPGCGIRSRGFEWNRNLIWKEKQTKRGRWVTFPTIAGKREKEKGKCCFVLCCLEMENVRDRDRDLQPETIKHRRKESNFFSIDSPYNATQFTFINSTKLPIKYSFSSASNSLTGIGFFFAISALQFSLFARGRRRHEGFTWFTHGGCNWLCVWRLNRELGFLYSGSLEGSKARFKIVALGFVVVSGNGLGLLCKSKLAREGSKPRFRLAALGSVAVGSGDLCERVLTIAAEGDVQSEKVKRREDEDGFVSSCYFVMLQLIVCGSTRTELKGKVEKANVMVMTEEEEEKRVYKHVERSTASEAGAVGRKELGGGTKSGGAENGGFSKDGMGKGGILKGGTKSGAEAQKVGFCRVECRKMGCCKMVVSGMVGFSQLVSYKRRVFCELSEGCEWEMVAQMERCKEVAGCQNLEVLERDESWLQRGAPGSLRKALPCCSFPWLVKITDDNDVLLYQFGGPYSR